jgi:hypothetical protein
VGIFWPLAVFNFLETTMLGPRSTSTISDFVGRLMLVAGTMAAAAATVEGADAPQVAAAKAAGADQLPSDTKADWGEIHFGAGGLELHVARVPADGTIGFPRLNNPIGGVYLKDDKAKTPLAFKPGTTTWAVTLPKSAAADAAAVVVVETLGQPYLPNAPRVLGAADDGSVTLAAHDAVTHGEMLRYEPQPHKNTVGYWVNKDDWCEWHFTVARPGRFDLHVLQGCGKGQGGSQVAVLVGDQRVQFTVEDTGHFQNFKDRNVGSITLAEPGRYTLQIRPVSKAANAIMDVRQVRLVPAPR